MILFFILTPGIIFRFPFEKYKSALLHAFLFTILLYIKNKCVEGNDDSIVLTMIYKDAILKNTKDKNLKSALFATKYK